MSCTDYVLRIEGEKKNRKVLNRGLENYWVD